jgi:hypothetical protein
LFVLLRLQFFAPVNDMLEGYIVPHDGSHSVFQNVTDNFFPFNFAASDTRVSVRVARTLPRARTYTWLNTSLWVTGHDVPLENIWYFSSRCGLGLSLRTQTHRLTNTTDSTVHTMLLLLL